MALTIRHEGQKSIRQLEEDKIWSNFINSLKSERTKITYEGYIKRFMQFHNITDYSSLLKLGVSITTIKNGQIQTQIADIEDKIKSYFVERRKNNISTSDMTGFLASLRKFYEGNDIENIRWRKLSGYMGEVTPKNDDRCYTHEEIHTLLNNSDLKLKVVILLMASAGLRVGALSTLLIKHLEKKVDHGIYKISVYKGLKGKGQYYTFCSPECVTAIDNYLSYRERCGEKIIGESPLLRKDFDSSLKASKVIPANYDGIRMSVYTLLVKSGIRVVNSESSRRNRNDIMMTHGFRKFYETMLVHSNIHETIIRKLTGHSENGNLTQRYSKQIEEKMLEEYMKAIDLLTINEENRLRKKVENFEKEDTEKIQMRNRINLLETKIKNFTQQIVKENEDLRKSLASLKHT